LDLVISYTVTSLSGTPPFSSEITWHKKSLAEQILGAIYTFPEDDWRGVSEPGAKSNVYLWSFANKVHTAKDLIRKLLVADPVQRYGVDACLAHPWMMACIIASLMFVAHMSFEG
jgi:hypothetical protein